MDAKQYKKLLHNWEAVQSTDPQAAKLKAEAKQAIDAGDYAKAESLLEDIAKHYSLAAAKAHADNARLQRVQLRYAKAAAYWQAAALLPEDEKKDRAKYLGEAGNDLHRVAKYKEALPLYEQSLVIRQEIGDKAGEGTTLNNLATIAYAKGDRTTTLKYLEQSLSISREIGDRRGEAVMSWNIGWWLNRK
ncbi:MAG: tetratricopeptide repeat protein [Candidatus Electronema sp. VV]